MEKEENKQQKYLTYFLLFFPTILVAIVPSTFTIAGIASTWTSFSLKLLLAFYQFIALKNFIDRHYQ